MITSESAWDKMEKEGIIKLVSPEEAYQIIKEANDKAKRDNLIRDAEDRFNQYCGRYVAKSNCPS